jgi:hypothetical protein
MMKTERNAAETQERQKNTPAEVYLFHHYLASLKYHWRPKSELELIEKIHSEFKAKFNLNN